jgi:DNA polymerase-3 subunit epsilon
MFEKSLAIVDVETTGMSARYHRIIEIAIIRVEGDKVVDTFTSLINPKAFIPPIITHITGIREEDLVDAHALWQFLRKIKKEIPKKLVQNTWEFLTKG